MKKCIWILLVGSILALLLTGCSYEKQSEDDSTGTITSTIRQDDLEIVFTNEKQVYVLDELNQDDPFGFTVTIKNISSKKPLSIWHGKPLCGIYITDMEGNAVLERTMLALLMETTLDFEEQLVFADPYTLDVIKKTMEKGDYRVCAYIEYQLGDVMEDPKIPVRKLRLEIPFTLE